GHGGARRGRAARGEQSRHEHADGPHGPHPDTRPARLTDARADRPTAAEMARPPVVRGELAEGGALELLRALEHQRVTGTLRFAGDEVEGEIALHGGQIAIEQPPRADGRDPVDVLLELGPGRYEVHARLPPLSVSKGTDYERTGSLAVHVPADLMTYCEHAGLSGMLELRHQGRRVEAIYEAGELLAIQLDGEGTTDLSEVFGWEQGRFRIVLDP